MRYRGNKIGPYERMDERGGWTACRGADPLPKLGVFKCVRLPDTQSQKRHHNVTSQNDVTRTKQNRLGL